MKKKLVLWVNKGSEETLEKILVTLELKADTNKVIRTVFAKEDATEELFLSLLKKWQKGEEIELPEQKLVEELELSASLSFLPEELESKDSDLLQRTQMEWIFIVLSTKLYKNYQLELEEIQEKVDGLEKYTKKAWDEMKTFWSKVQEQTREDNLFKEHSQVLKAQTNKIFEQLKTLRSAEDAAFEVESTENATKINESLVPIEKLIAENGGDFRNNFNKLKAVQDEFKKLKFTRNTRSKLWDRIDKAFKLIKEKRSPNVDNSANVRLNNRVGGLKKAIDKMQSSIDRDQRELDTQKSRLSSSNVGQLETQLREVKAKLINERITSKTRKLDDMHKTLGELETKLEKIEARQNKEKKAAEAAKEKAAAALEKVKVTEEEKPTEKPTEEVEETKVEEAEVVTEAPKEENDVIPATNTEDTATKEEEEK